MKAITIVGAGRIGSMIADLLAGCGDYQVEVIDQSADQLDRLERQGVIIGYSARLSPDHERGAVRAHVLITVRPKEARAVEAALRNIPQVRALQSVSGVFDMIAQIVADSTTEMDDLVDAIGALGGVERTTSSIVLSTKFDR